MADRSLIMTRGLTNPDSVGFQLVAAEGREGRQGRQSQDPSKKQGGLGG